MKQVPIVFFCGGRKIYDPNSQKEVLKPLYSVSGRPMIIHNIHHYVKNGFSHFIMSGTSELNQIEKVIRDNFNSTDLKFDYVNTGETTNTGGRLAGVRELIENSAIFGLHYSDTLSNLPVREIFEFHKQHGKMVSLAGVRMPIRFRILGVRSGETIVRGFAVKPVIRTDFINGGYYFMNSEVLQEALVNQSGAVLETGLLEKLSHSGELMMWPWEGDWQFLDAPRDCENLENILQSMK